MRPPLARIRAALSRLPLQLRLVALVVLAAGGSVLYSAVAQRSASSGEAAQRDRVTADAPLEVSDPEAGAAVSRPVEEAFDAARRGDLEGYLAQFAEPLRGQLARMRGEKGDGYLQDYLRRLSEPIKGLAVRLSEQQEVGPETLRCPVELVYQDRNEVQSFTLKRAGDRWLIERIDSVRAARTLIPYGTHIKDVR